MRFPNKLIDEVWNCGVDFAQQLAAGETVVSAAATVRGGTITVANVSASGSVALFQVSGGVAGWASIEVSVTTSSSEVLGELATFEIV